MGSTLPDTFWPSTSRAPGRGPHGASDVLQAVSQHWEVTNRERKNNKTGIPSMACPRADRTCLLNTHEKENRAKSNIHRHTRTHSRGRVINGRCPLCLKSHWRASGSPNTRNSSRGRPVKSNILLHTGRWGGGGLRM